METSAGSEIAASQKFGACDLMSSDRETIQVAMPPPVNALTADVFSFDPGRARRHPRT